MFLKKSCESYSSTFKDSNVLCSLSEKNKISIRLMFLIPTSFSPIEIFSLLLLEISQNFKNSSSYKWIMSFGSNQILMFNQLGSLAVFQSIFLITIFQSSHLQGISKRAFLYQSIFQLWN
ncbi:MAG: hypothetical protein ACD_4C00460G0001, partial [uncultured bacterium (gcode 4)]